MTNARHRGWGRRGCKASPRRRQARRRAAILARLRRAQAFVKACAAGQPFVPAPPQKAARPGEKRLSVGFGMTSQSWFLLSNRERAEVNLAETGASYTI